MKPRPFPCPNRRVLIVDQSQESREVLRTVLEHRGVEIFETGEARHGLELARRHQPDVIVLDLEAESADDELVRQQYHDQTHRHNISLVLLGVTPRPVENVPQGRVVAKPYHYGPLIRTIEGLFEGARAAGQL